MKNIILAIDFAENRKILTGYATEIAKNRNAKVWVIHIAAPEPFFVGYDVGPESERKFRADTLRDEHRTIQAIAKNMRNKGIDSEALLISGSTVKTLIEQSEKLNADLIIIGFHKRGFFASMFGDITIDVLKKTKIPLLSIPT